MAARLDVVYWRETGDWEVVADENVNPYFLKGKTVESDVLNLIGFPSVRLNAVRDDADGVVIDVKLGSDFGRSLRFN